MAHLQRITERLSSIDSLQVQTLRKLEGLDYRYRSQDVWPIDNLCRNLTHSFLLPSTATSV